MGAIQGAINQAVGSVASVATRTKGFKEVKKLVDLEQTKASTEAVEKQAESNAYNEAQKQLKSNPNLNVAQFIRNATTASLAANKSYQQMLIMQQGMAQKKKSLLDLI